jgi:GT2 family glycosyltransferase
VAGRILFNRSISGGSGSLATCSQMAPRAVYEQLGGFDEQFRRAEDTDFCLRLALAGGHFVGINEPLVVQSITYGSDKSLANERFYTLKLYEKHRMALGGRYEFDHGWIEAKYDLLSGQKGLFLRRLGKLAVQHPFMTLHRAFLALPNIGYNKIFSQFYNHKP